ncbi:MAG: hypothetical protein SGJ19_00820 [Planctomycetia bacterium]|nr:hypothetical protein [Planctomycetia bacterium]
MTDNAPQIPVSKWRHAWQKQRAIMLCAIIAVIVTGLIVQPWKQQPWLAWWQWMDAVFGVATLAVALIVWWGELTENWEHNLPKRLRVVFLFDNQPVLVCEDAPLITETDIRAMAQQIGKQMNDNKELSLRPFFEPLLPIIDRQSKTGPVRRYEIRMTLKELPTSLAERRNSDPSLIRKVWPVANGVEQETFEKV